jgi:hypothetical protein
MAWLLDCNWITLNSIFRYSQTAQNQIPNYHKPPTAVWPTNNTNQSGANQGNTMAGQDRTGQDRLQTLVISCLATTKQSSILAFVPPDQDE